MSRLATVVGALSAVVTLVDYLAAKSFLSHWLQRQISRDDAGWRVSPTLNLLFIAALVGLVWLATDAPASEPTDRKRLFQLRAQLVMGGLAVWFLSGPVIGNVDVNDSSTSPEARVALPPVASGGSPTADTAQRPSPPGSSGHAAALAAGASHGHTSQFTWRRPVQPALVNGSWKPGDGLRAMARLLDSEPAMPPGR